MHRPPPITTVTAKMPWPFGKKKTKESRSDSDASQTESAAASAVKSVAAKNKKSATLKHQTSNTTVSAAVAAATNAAATPHERLSRWLLRSKTRHEEPQIPPMVRNYKVPANLEELVTALTATEGTPFTRFLSNKKTSSVHLRLDLTTYQINYYTGGSTEGRPTASSACPCTPRVPSTSLCRQHVVPMVPGSERSTQPEPTGHLVPEN